MNRKQFKFGDRVIVAHGSDLDKTGKVVKAKHITGLVQVQLDDDGRLEYYDPLNLDPNLELVSVSGVDSRDPEYCGDCEGRCVYEGPIDQEEVTHVLSPREDLLEEAKQLITGDRNNTYGPPTQDFQRTAEAASAYGYGKKDQEGNWTPLESHDVGLLVMLVKISRLQWSPGKRDSYVDIAGYSACSYECAVEEGHV